MLRDFRLLRRSVQILIGSAVAAFALLALLLGWLAGLQQLVRVRADYHAMVPTTAICFILLGSALVLAQHGRFWRRVNGRRILALVIGIALVNVLLKEIFHRPGLDALLPFGLREGDMMASGTGLGMLVACYCIDCVALDRPPKSDMCVVAAIAGMVTSFAILLGHSFTSVADASTWLAKEISVPAVIMFLALFFALALPNVRRALSEEAFWDDRRP